VKVEMNDFDLYKEILQNWKKEFLEPIDGERFLVESTVQSLICGNFYNFLMNNVFLRDQNYFDKSLYAVYENGGISCRWKGSNPDGSMLVFSSN